MHTCMTCRQRTFGVVLYPENYKGLTAAQKESDDSRNALINKAVAFWLENRPRQEVQEFEGGQNDGN